jgi:hypothetical protein
MPGRFYRAAPPYRGKRVDFAGYEFNRASIARLAVGPEMRDAMSDIVEEAIMYAQLIAPSDTHAYQSSFDTDVHVVQDIPFRVRGDEMARWSGRVVNHDRSAIYVEVGSGDTGDGARVMRRTLEWIESAFG